ncbi:MAG TPA: septum formation initiator family protein [Verrucomicrobiae bacterium]|nr:septum formation initiator family protein [Verrucomicrobiae bacterium]
MARNRKHRSAAIRFGPALKAFLLCLLLGGSGVGYVWQKNQIYDLGRQIKEREARLSALDKENEKLKKQLGTMHSTWYLEKRIKDLNLGLAQPAPSQIWRLPEPGPDPAPSAEPSQVAAR